MNKKLFLIGFMMFNSSYSVLAMESAQEGPRVEANDGFRTSNYIVSKAEDERFMYQVRVIRVNVKEAVALDLDKIRNYFDYFEAEEQGTLRKIFNSNDLVVLFNTMSSEEEVLSFKSMLLQELQRTAPSLAANFVKQ